MALVQTEELTRVLKDFDLQANPRAVSEYADVLHFKNGNIQRLFENYPDGRIVINAKKACSLDSVKNFGLDPSSKESEEIFSTIRTLIAQNTSLNIPAIIALTRGFRDVICSPFLNTRTKKIEDNTGLLSSLKGMKIGKALNLILDSNIITEYPISYEKKDIDYIRNSIIGGRIAELIDNASAASDDLSLVLSINPLDFLTMSCGTSWDSCMYPNGEYSTGTLPYATGKDTVIGFLVKTEDYELEIERSGWSNKIWRQIMYLTDDNFIISQNPYPGDKPKFSIALSAYINEALGLGLEITKKASFENAEKLHVWNVGISTGYIDLEHSGYLPYIFGPTDEGEENGVGVCAQSVAFCLDCGELKEDCEMADSCGVCNNCSDNYDCYCDDCGEGFYDGEGAWIDGYEICESCLEDNYCYSEYASEFIHNDVAVEVKTIRKMDGNFYASSDVVGEYDLDGVAILVRDIDFLPETLPPGLDLDDYIFLDDLEEVKGGHYLLRLG